jgi:hypothetical protein
MKIWTIGEYKVLQVKPAWKIIPMGGGISSSCSFSKNKIIAIKYEL